MSIVVPWRPDDDGRSANWVWTRRRWEALYPDFEVVTGQPPSGSFNAAQAVNDGARRAKNALVVVAWADVAVDNAWLLSAIDRVAYGECAVATPAEVCRLDRYATTDLRETSPGDPLDIDPFGPLVEERRSGWAEIAVTTRFHLEAIPFDQHFDGWGHEGHAWLLASEKLTGGVDARGRSYHLWHRSRPGTTWDTPGAADRRALFHRYVRAAASTNDEWMKVLVSNCSS